MFASEAMRSDRTRPLGRREAVSALRPSGRADAYRADLGGAGHLLDMPLGGLRLGRRPRRAESGAGSGRSLKNFFAFIHKGEQRFGGLRSQVFQADRLPNVESARIIESWHAQAITHSDRSMSCPDGHTAFTKAISVDGELVATITKSSRDRLATIAWQAGYDEYAVDVAAAVPHRRTALRRLGAEIMTHTICDQSYRLRPVDAVVNHVLHDSVRIGAVCRTDRPAKLEAWHWAVDARDDRPLKVGFAPTKRAALDMVAAAHYVRHFIPERRAS